MVCVIWVDRPTTVMVYVPVAVVLVVETCRIDEVLAPGLSLTLEGVTVTVGAVPFDRDIVAVRDTVPANPPILVRIKFEEEFDPR